jgi:hypothetical protein
MYVNGMERSVWQRVRPEMQTENATLKVLAMETQQAIGEYRQLLKSRVESHRELGRRLLASEQENMACLQGLHYLQTGEPMKLPMTNPIPVDVKRMVRRYHSARKMLGEYMAGSAQPEWGVVYQAMAKRQEKQCDWLCQLVGHMK